jgi:hypothetical protein
LLKEAQDPDGFTQSVKDPLTPGKPATWIRHSDIARQALVSLRQEMIAVEVP